jgi:hypothetical protein
MATIATPFADMEAGLAARLLATMANAVVTLGDGAAAGTQLPAVFSQPIADGVGDQRMPGREPSVMVATSSLVPDVKRGSALQVLYLGTTSNWRVHRRTDAPEAGDTLLDLEVPT